MARALELFFFLLDAGRSLRKEQIITALWPEADQQIDHTFYNTIYYVRKALGESCLVSENNTYILSLASASSRQVWYDVSRFQEEYAQAKQALSQEADAAARAALLAMLDLYRGDYLQPFYSNWCAFRRDELRTAALDAHFHLAQLAWKHEEWEESAQHWQQMVAVDPCREEAHAGLMRCYLRQGKRGLALRQYQRCRDSLRQELGIDPGPTLQHLYQRLSADR
jgi:two-component SAPR family response regulator